MRSLFSRVSRVGRRARWLWQEEGVGAVALRTLLRLRLYRPRPLDPCAELRDWFKHFRPDPETLQFFKSRPWPAQAPKFSILMPVYNVRRDWLIEALRSVMAQVYANWELVCVNDGSTQEHVRATLEQLAGEDDRIRVIHRADNGGVSSATNVALREATGNYVCLMDHDDVLEPQALYQFARVILQDEPDLLYSDEAVTGEDSRDILRISARCQFSYDYFLSHPYFVHLLGVRTELVRRVGGMNEAIAISQDVDLILRLLEMGQTISYVPDVLYRWRTHGGSLGHQQKDNTRAATRAAIERHLGRIGVEAEVHNETTPFNFVDVRFRSADKARVAIIIPTKNQARFLRDCIASLERTVPADLADLIVIDHESDEPDAVEALRELRQRHRVVPYAGPFNYSAIVNFSVGAVRGPYTHYLFLNNDTAAIRPGWLEHMLGFGQRPDVGVVGATLLYADDRVQHGGVIIGLVNCAEHSHKMWPFWKKPGQREVGHNGSLASNRDYSAVTGACMLIRADVFDKVHGFDEELAVGFNDTDLCLRVRQLGYKVIQDAHAVLYHYESQTRAEHHVIEHPGDNQRFSERHGHLVFGHDPFYSPLLSRLALECPLTRSATSPVSIRAFTERIILPKAVGVAPPFVWRALPHSLRDSA